MTTDRDVLHQVIAAWESLKGGHDHPASAVERWLCGPMLEAIDAARAQVKRPLQAPRKRLQATRTGVGGCMGSPARRG